jgi:hypothetical protein
VTSEIVGEFDSWVHIDNLDELRHQVVIDVFSDIFVSVTGACQEDAGTFNVKGVKRDLEDSGFDLLRYV